MKYVPKPVDHSVNAPNHRPIRDFFQFTLYIALICIGIYWMLGLLVDWGTPRISPEYERKLAKKLGFLEQRVESPLKAELESICHPLLKQLPESERDVYVRLMPDLRANAYAFPGGMIGVTVGLLHDVDSENGLAMVMGHELGHFHYRHHLRSFGRALVVALATSLFMGQEYGARVLVNASFSRAHENYSQTEEQMADAFGLELLVKTYGHAGGSAEVFHRWSQKDKRWLHYLFGGSHPLSADRAKALEDRIRQAGYPVKKVKPLPKRIKQLKRGYKITTTSYWDFLKE